MASKGDGDSRSEQNRAARQAAELRANLKKRKDLARARATQPAAAKATPEPAAGDTGQRKD